MPNQGHAKECRAGSGRGKRQVRKPTQAGDGHEVGDQSEQRLHRPGDADDAEKPANLTGREVPGPELRLHRLRRQAGRRLDNSLHEVQNAEDDQQRREARPLGARPAAGECG